MSKKAIMTEVTQYNVIILDEKDWPEGYQYNRPSDEWQLIEYVDIKNKDGSPIRCWTPNYKLTTPKINDFSNVSISQSNWEIVGNAFENPVLLKEN